MGKNISEPFVFVFFSGQVLLQHRVCMTFTDTTDFLANAPDDKYTRMWLLHGVAGPHGLVTHLFFRSRCAVPGELPGNLYVS